MKTISLNFKLHIPLKLKHYPFYKIGSDHSYYDENEYRSRINTLCDTIYDPILKALSDLTIRHQSDFKFGIQVTGSSIILLEKYRPSTLKLLKSIVVSDSCELLSGTFSNSLSSLIDKEAFQLQVSAQNRILEDVMERRCTTFINCEQIYDDSIGDILSQEGQLIVIADLSSKTKGDNYLYNSTPHNKLKLLSYNKKISIKTADYIYNTDCESHTLLDNILSPRETGNIITLIVDCDRALTSHNLEDFVTQVVKSHCLEFMTPNQCAQEYDYKSTLSISSPADVNLSPLSMEAMRIIHSKELLNACRNKELQLLLLQSSDLFNIISNKPLSDGGCEAHPSSLQHYINYMNIVSDLSEKKFC